jgi:hypothetical protein
MSPDPYDNLPISYITIKQGATFYRTFAFVNVEGRPMEFASDPAGAWIGRCTVESGPRFHSDPGEGADGTITFDDAGNVALSLDAATTAALSPTAEGVRLAADLELVDPDTGDVISPFEFIYFRIIREVTV